MSGFDNATFAPSTYSGPTDLSGDPGGLQGAVPGVPAPAPTAPFDSVPMVQGPMDLPGISVEANLGMPMSDDVGGAGIVEAAVAMSQQTGMPTAELLATAQRLAEQIGIPVEMAMQVMAQSMQSEQLQGGRYA